MTIEKFLDRWYDKEITDWGAQSYPAKKQWKTDCEYSDFQKNYRNVIKDFCKDIGMELYSFNNSHYEFSAVIKSYNTNQFYYMRISDVRYWKNEWADNILFRIMKNEKDYVSGDNRYSTLRDLPENLLNLDIEILLELERDNDKNTDKVDIQNKKNDNLEINYV